MKKRIVLVIAAVLIAAGSFMIGRASESPNKKEISLEDIKGWESWETESEVGIELQTKDASWIITKAPYTPIGIEISRER